MGRIRLGSLAAGLALPVILGTGSLGAQGPVLRLSLDEAIAVAREHNPGFARFRNDVHVASLAERAQRAQYLPSVSLSTGVSGSYSRQVTGLDPFGTLIRRDTAIVNRGSSMSQAVGIQLPVIYDGGRRPNALRAARAGTRAAEARVTAQEVQLRANVSRAYLTYLAARLQERLEERQLASQEVRLEMTERLFRVASADRLDLLGAREQLATRERNLARARANSERDRIALLSQLGRDLSLEVQLTDTAMPLFDPRELDAEAIVGTALQLHPTMAEAEAVHEGALHGRRAARGGSFPRIAPSVSYSRSIGRRNYDAFTDFEMPQNQSMGFGLNLTFDVFNRYQTANEVARAEADLQDAEHTLRLQRQTVERDVRSALIELENAYRSLELARLSAGYASERLDLAMEQYRLGSIPYDRLQTLIEGAAAAERGELDARVAFASALYTLDERVGQAVRP
ncbi:MAG TPA: TolC family protein [Gemmatimonadaceae bacterium]|nr:TolC family protein [Gemmatimonadaceae bacterium]